MVTPCRLSGHCHYENDGVVRSQRVVVPHEHLARHTSARSTSTKSRYTFQQSSTNFHPPSDFVIPKGTLQHALYYYLEVPGSLYSRLTSRQILQSRYLYRYHQASSEREDTSNIQRTTTNISKLPLQSPMQLPT